MNASSHHIFPDRDALAVSVTAEVDRLLKLSAESGSILHLALSGGSTPLAIFRKLRDVSSHREWSGIRLWWGDERCVPPDDAGSNYGNAYHLLIGPLNLSPGQVFRIRGEDDPRQEARRYGNLLLEQLPVDHHGNPVFDWIWLGMGEDGHTASLFPEEPALWDAPAPCVVATHPGTGQSRITITGRVINAAKRVTFLVTGKNKAEVVREVLRKEGRFREYPAAMVAPAGGKLEWYLDVDAASEL
ncbi:MAG: 6-phosphogluconolactonase [Bacteroidales bacterium]